MTRMTLLPTVTIAVILLAAPTNQTFATATNMGPASSLRGTAAAVTRTRRARHVRHVRHVHSCANGGVFAGVLLRIQTTACAVRALQKLQDPRCIVIQILKPQSSSGVTSSCQLLSILSCVMSGQERKRLLASPAIMRRRCPHWIQQRPEPGKG